MKPTKLKPTNEEIDLAITQAFGIEPEYVLRDATGHTLVFSPPTREQGERLLEKVTSFDKSIAQYAVIPVGAKKYSEDLNAVREVELLLTEEELAAYHKELGRVGIPARDLCLAILRVKGK
jgi:hypothetical protein